MGDEITTEWEPTEANRRLTRQLAYKEIAHRQRLAEQGFFTKPHRTCDIEHEIRAIDAMTGQGVDATALFAHDALGARPDTSTDNVEIDAAPGVSPLNAAGLWQLYAAFGEKVNRAQQALQSAHPAALLVPIGVAPLQRIDENYQLMVAKPARRRRYEILDRVTLAENPDKRIVISHPQTAATFEDVASYLPAMQRCSGTQLHISEHTVAEALAVHNISIAIAPLLIAIFGNSPYLDGTDLGRASTRIELLRQAEQLRAGLPLPALSLEQYYRQQIGGVVMPFIELEDPAHALQLAHGAIHTVSRIQVDMQAGTIRNEFRHVDSQSPFHALQAFLLTWGMIEALRGKPLPPYEESHHNFRHCVFGLAAPMRWFGRSCSAQSLAEECLQTAAKHLRKRGCKSLVRHFLDPLVAEIRRGDTQAQQLRRNVAQYVAAGLTQPQAISQAVQELRYISP